MDRFGVADGASVILSSLVIVAIAVFVAIATLTVPERTKVRKLAPSTSDVSRPSAAEPEKMGRIALPPPPLPSAPVRSPPPPAVRNEPAAPKMIVSPLSPKPRPATRAPSSPPLGTLAPMARPEPDTRSGTPGSEPERESKADRIAANSADAKTVHPSVTAKPDDRPGRALLRLLEHGNGPSIEFAWPSQRPQRDRLYRHLTACHGMRAAVMDKAKRLYAEGGPPKAPWKLNADRYSGFLRLPQGRPVPEEEGVFSRLAAYHGLEDWQPVRVFPRSVDAALLGGLERLIGERYRKARTVTAVYELRRGALLLTGIVVDNRPVAGKVTLASQICR